MIVVSDSSPLIVLAAVGHLDLLRDLFGDVLIPEEVHREIVHEGAGQPGAQEVQDAKWIHVQRASNRSLIQALVLQLDSGESEALALALERGADLLLVDERRARRVAELMGMKVIGVLGVLLQAKQKGLIQEVGAVLDSLTTRAAFRVSQQIREQVLRLAGE